jgi:hypothetical protein
MALSDERQQVLRMVEQGTITADEGSKLIMALGIDEQAEQREPEPPEEHAEAPAEAAATNDDVQVRIALASGDGHVVTLVLPLQLARFALPLLDLPHAAVLGEHGVDINRIREALRSGEPCDILDYQDEESGHRIQIVIA